MLSERTLTPERSKAHHQGNYYPSVISPLLRDAMTCNTIPALQRASVATDGGGRNLCFQAGKQQESLLGSYCDYTVTMTLAADPNSHYPSLKRTSGFMGMYWAAEYVNESVAPEPRVNKFQFSIFLQQPSKCVLKLLDDVYLYQA